MLAYERNVFIRRVACSKSAAHDDPLRHTNYWPGVPGGLVPLEPPGSTVGAVFRRIPIEI